MQVEPNQLRIDSRTVLDKPEDVTASEEIRCFRTT